MHSPDIQAVRPAGATYLISLSAVIYAPIHPGWHDAPGRFSKLLRDAS
jgi:hypothetical protein